MGNPVVRISCWDWSPWFKKSSSYCICTIANFLVSFWQNWPIAQAYLCWTIQDNLYIHLAYIYWHTHRNDNLCSCYWVCTPICHASPHNHMHVLFQGILFWGGHKPHWQPVRQGSSRVMVRRILTVLSLSSSLVQKLNSVVASTFGMIDVSHYGHITDKSVKKCVLSMYAYLSAASWWWIYTVFWMLNPCSASSVVMMLIRCS